MEARIVFTLLYPSVIPFQSFVPSAYKDETLLLFPKPAEYEVLIFNWENLIKEKATNVWTYHQVIIYI